jgi:dUTP pyrophosphatase
MKIKIKLIDGQEMPKIINKGEWIDLRAGADAEISAASLNEDGTVSFRYCAIPLGVCMEIPKGYEAIIAPRSSTLKQYGIISANSIGIIDNSYKGDDDEWMFPAVALRTSYIQFGDRICQFRIQLSQKATVWQKIKWIFSRKIEFVEVDFMDNDNRGGLGEGTGHND